MLVACQASSQELDQATPKWVIARCDISHILRNTHAPKTPTTYNHDRNKRRPRRRQHSTMRGIISINVGRKLRAPAMLSVSSPLIVVPTGTTDQG